MRALSSLRVLHLLRIPRKRPCQDQGISDREQDQSGKMQKLRLHCKLCIICKRAERVDGGMDEDAGEQTAAAGKDRDHALRREYIDSVLGNLKGQLDNTYIVDEQGNKTKLQKKGEK